MISPETRALSGVYLKNAGQKGRGKDICLHEKIYGRQKKLSKDKIEHKRQEELPDKSERSGRQIMKYAYQVMIIGGISFAGELLNTLLPLPVPASVYGMVILLICLCTKVIRLNQIQETADFMLAAMPLVFVGPGVALMESFGLMKDSLLGIVMISIVSMVFVMILTGLIAQFLVIKKRRLEEERLEEEINE